VIRPAVLITGASIVMVVVTAAIYTASLDSSPPYLSADETHFALHARRLALSGTDLGGNRFPVFFQIFDPLSGAERMHVWYQPFLFYVLALRLHDAPLQEATVRQPVAMIAVLNVALMFLVARRWFKSAMVAIAAAALLAMTPAHFVFGRLAVDYICPLPFVLAWLWMSARYSETREARDLAAATLLLGLGVFTYITSWVLMPWLALATMVALRPPVRHAALAAATLVAPAALLLPTQRALGTVLTDLFVRYGVAPTAATAVGTWSVDSIGSRLELYWDYFNPSFLFFAGGNDLLMTTSYAGLFLLATAVPMAVGIWSLARQRSPIGLLVLLGFFGTPLPIVITLPEAPHSSTGRVLLMLVFGVLIACQGFTTMWQARGAARAAAVVLMLMAPVQFALFQADYFSDYRTRSWFRFDPQATRDLVTAVMAIDQQRRAPQVLLHDDGDNKGIRWRFYTARHGQEDLWARTRYYRVEAIDDTHAPPGSLLLLPANDARAARLVAAGYTRIASVDSISGEAASDIYRRDD
jgi:hypothetical protein